MKTIMIVAMAEPRNTTVLVTGSSSGLGKLTAITAARAGYRVYASMRDIGGKNRQASRELQQLAERDGVNVQIVDLDVTVPASVDAAVERIVREAGAVDVLVNNAGHMSIGLAEGFAEEQIRQQFEVNFFGPVLLCRAVLPGMRQRRSGLIVHVSSIVGRVLFPACAFYCASKFALEAYAEVLHYEVSGFGIDSVLVQPGPYPTHLLANSPAPRDEERIGTYGELSRIRDLFVNSFGDFFASEQAPNPQEVADAVVGLIEQPAGSRALRTVCGPDYGAIAINRHTAPLQAEVLRAIGMGALAHRADLSAT
jgi:NAD(P)-dependent dehydrogenase (short-subunit alcohol dehydrogenase family)